HQQQRKWQWTDQEDSIVIDAVTNSSEQPFTRWSDLVQRLPGRVRKQIQDRWVNYLNPNIDHLPFSREEDLLLWECHKKLGKRWAEISTKSFNSTRPEKRIKNRWYSASFKKI
ncbi:C-Myb R2r3, partial [Fragilariopsis cylindrus CCMP1102]